MKHPDREEWIPYLWGETSPEVKTQLTNHLESCPECREQVAMWNRTLRKLDSWKLPQRSAREAVPPALVRWAVAAMLVLGIGFGLGRISSYASFDPNKLRSDLEISLRASLAAELQQQQRPAEDKAWQAALAATRSQISNDFQAQLAIERDQIMAGVMNVSARDGRRHLNEFIQFLQTTRDEDRQNTLLLLREVQKQHATDYLALRKDLETVASLTDDEIQQARLKFIQLAASTRPDGND